MMTFPTTENATAKRMEIAQTQHEGKSTILTETTIINRHASLIIHFHLQMRNVRRPAVSGEEDVHRSTQKDAVDATPPQLHPPQLRALSLESDPTPRLSRFEWLTAPFTRFTNAHDSSSSFSHLAGCLTLMCRN
eukprot:scaffold2874_cov110-Alexandrium_tamarense.AAC.11